MSAIMDIIENYKKQVLSLDSEIPVVWNNKLNSICDESSIKLILCCDNPGKEEQRDNIYLSPNGKCGKMAKNFFSQKLGLTLHEEVIVVNKTPFFTTKTADLEAIPEKEKDIFLRSQEIMASLAVDLLKSCNQKGKNTDLWILGASQKNFGKKPLFGKFKDAIKEQKKNNELWEHIFCFYHFSRGQFYKESYKDMDKEKMTNQEELKRILSKIGIRIRDRFFQ